MQVTKFYVLSFPVWKQGSDLATHLNEEETSADAFEALAERYESAAAQARQMAAAAREVPAMEVTAGTHHIGIEAPDHPVIDKLVEEDILTEEEEGGGTYAD